jgi:uncharacterized membrane protein
MSETLDKKDTARLENFSDNVFSFAMTLLVLSITVPRIRDASASDLATALLGELVPLGVLVLSFATIYIVWVNHHEFFRLVPHTDGRVLASNGLLLLFVMICPFPTAILASYLGHGAGKLAAGLYAGYFALTNLAFNLLVESAARSPHPEPHGVDGTHVVRTRARLGLVAYVVATIAAFWSAWVSVALCALLWAYWAYRGFGPGDHRPSR